MHVIKTFRAAGRRRWAAAGLALAAGGGLAAGFPMLPAVGQQSPPSQPIIIGSRAAIVARGAAAAPWAYVVCPAGQYGQLNISLTERVGRRIASGSGYEQFYCTGAIETVKVPVTPQYAPFAAGKAYAQAQLYTYSGFAQANRSVTLYVKK